MSSRSERVLPVARDVICLGLGAYGFVEQVRGTPDWPVMLGCILLLGGPALVRAYLLGRSGGESTTGSSSGSPLPPSPPPAPSAPSSASAAGER